MSVYKGTRRSRYLAQQAFKNAMVQAEREHRGTGMKALTRDAVCTPAVTKVNAATWQHTSTYSLDEQC
jgi:hypothetical protein